MPHRRTSHTKGPGRALIRARGPVVCLLAALLAYAPSAHAQRPPAVPARSIKAAGHRIVSAAPIAALRTLSDLDAMATTIVGEPTMILCESADQFAAAGQGDADGYVVFHNGVPEHIAHLREHWCTRLESLGLRANSGDRERYPSWVDIYPPTGEMMSPLDGAALLVLNHELLHIRLASGDEAHVNRCALVNLWPLEALFHLSSWMVHRVDLGALDHYQHERAPYQDDKEC